MTKKAHLWFAKSKIVGENLQVNEKNVIHAFDLYSKEVGVGNENERVTTFSSKTWTSQDYTIMLKNLLCKISNKGKSKLRFIS